MEFVHLLGAVLLTGYALFRVRMAREIRGQGAEEARLREGLRRFRWPPRGVPSPVRVSLDGLGWTVVVVVAAAGALLLAGGAWAIVLEDPLSTRPGRLFVAKGGLVLALVLAHGALAARPTPPRAYAFGLVTLLVVGVSALMLR